MSLESQQASVEHQHFADAQLRRVSEALLVRWEGAMVPKVGECDEDGWCSPKSTRSGMKRIVVHKNLSLPLLLKVAAQPREACAQEVREESRILGLIRRAANGTDRTARVLWTSPPFSVRLSSGEAALAVLQQRVASANAGSIIFPRHSGISYALLNLSLIHI